MIRMTRVAADAQHGSGTMTTDRVDHQQACGGIITRHRAVDQRKILARRQSHDACGFSCFRRACCWRASTAKFTARRVDHHDGRSTTDVGSDGSAAMNLSVVRMRCKNQEIAGHAAQPRARSPQRESPRVSGLLFGDFIDNRNEVRTFFHIVQVGFHQLLKRPLLLCRSLTAINPIGGIPY